jgi:hypothetical protein
MAQKFHKSYLFAGQDKTMQGKRGVCVQRTCTCTDRQRMARRRCVNDCACATLPSGKRIRSTIGCNPLNKNK